MSANVINRVIFVSIYTIKTERLVNKLVERSSVEECTENIDETRLVEINSTQWNTKFDPKQMQTQFLQTVYCVILKRFYGQHWNW